jgi:hypothetical protein
MDRDLLNGVATQRRVFMKPGSSRRIRWGILGTGYAAACCVEALRIVPDAEVIAVASRSES